MLEIVEKSCDTAAMEAEFLTQSDREFIATLRAPKRLREVALWRATLRKMLFERQNQCDQEPEPWSAEILYDSAGAPYLQGARNIFFSVSHSPSAVAILLETNGTCAVDIELLERDFESVAQRFATAKEIEMLQRKMLQREAAREGAREGEEEQQMCKILPLIWSAKECAYKLWSHTEGRTIDFTKDMAITAIDPQAKKIEVQMNLHTLRLHYSFTELPGHVIVASSEIVAPR